MSLETEVNRLGTNNSNLKKVINNTNLALTNKSVSGIKNLSELPGRLLEISTSNVKFAKGDCKILFSKSEWNSAVVPLGLNFVPQEVLLLIACKVENKFITVWYPIKKGTILNYNNNTCTIGKCTLRAESVEFGFSKYDYQFEKLEVNGWMAIG